MERLGLAIEEPSPELLGSDDEDSDIFYEVRFSKRRGGKVVQRFLYSAS